MVFPLVMYGCESWTIKKAERWRIDAFDLWYWRRLLRVPWPARRSNQSILKEISPGCSLEGLMLKLKLQYFGHLMQRAKSFEKTLMLGKIEGRGWDGWMTSPTRWTWAWVDSGSWWWTGRPGMLWFMGSQRDWHDWATELKSGFNPCLSQSYHIHHLLSKGRHRSFSMSRETGVFRLETHVGRSRPFGNICLTTCLSVLTIHNYSGKDSSMDYLVPGESMTVAVSLFDN